MHIDILWQFNGSYLNSIDASLPETSLIELDEELQRDPEGTDLLVIFNWVAIQNDGSKKSIDCSSEDSLSQACNVLEREKWGGRTNGILSLSFDNLYA